MKMERETIKNKEELFAKCMLETKQIMSCLRCRNIQCKLCQVLLLCDEYEFRKYDWYNGLRTIIWSSTVWQNYQFKMKETVKNSTITWGHQVQVFIVIHPWKSGIDCNFHAIGLCILNEMQTESWLIYNFIVLQLCHVKKLITLYLY